MLRHCSLLLVSVLGFGLFCAACGDDAGTNGDGDAAVGDGGTPDGAVEARCSSDAECDNDQICDGEEACVAGVCVAGLPVRCDDGIECTIDRCSEALSGCESLPPDLDGDGHVDATCEDENGDAFGDDCDDNDPLRFPGNIETCDDQDDDCDPDTLGEKDSDGDGFRDGHCCNDGNCGEDCDDLKPSVNPTATEACDRFDNDCDGTADEDVAVDVYPDADRDGHGAEGAAVKRCPGSVGFALEADDCDDDDPEVFTGQFEICDEKDNNCDSVADEIHQDAPWFLDLDEDGFGDPASTPIFSCERVTGRVLSHNDCRDDAAAIHPAAAEACDAVDNDCNGLKDFPIGVNDFEDDDDDDLADNACGAGAPDCNDLNASTGAGLDEICDLADNDCDDKIDEQTAQTVWYLDRDGDGWGVNQGSALARCEPIPGRASNLGDCRDDQNAVHPGAEENCDGTDEDCDGHSDEGTDYLCDLPNAIAGCNFGACDVLACFAGYDDGDNVDSNGCETDLPLTPTGGTCLTTFTDSECNDGDYCNGREVCKAGNCYYGTAVVCGGPSVLQGSHEITSSFHIQQLAGIETITGDLTISGTDALETLAGLSGLKTIGGNLYIEDSSNLVSLAGLSGLTTVGGEIVVRGNGDLSSIDLPALVTAGAITISNNTGLVDIGGFGNLATVYGAIQIDSNPDLTTISGFGALRTAGSLVVEFNYLLATMGGFGALDHVLTDLSLYRNSHTAIAFPKLTRVDGNLDLTGVEAVNGQGPNLTTTSLSLPVLAYVGKHMTVNGLWNLTSLNLSKLDEVGGYLMLTSLNALVTLSLPELTMVGGLDVGFNSSLTSLSLPKLTNTTTDQIDVAQGIADGHFYVYSNALTSLSLPELQVVDGYMTIESAYGSSSDTTLASISAPKLTTVGDTLSVYALDALTTLSMGALTTVGGSLSLSNLLALTTLSMGALTTIGGNLSVSSLGQVTTLGMGALTSVSFDVSISFAPELTSLGLGALTTVGSTLDLYSLPLLTSIQLPQLTTVGYSLYVGSNSALDTLVGLGLRDQSNVLQLQVDNPSAYLQIYSNSTLCTEDANAFVAELVTNGYVGNAPYVSGNNDSCQSP